MELPDIKEDENLIVNEEKDNIIKNINDKNNLNAENAIILKKSIKLKDIPYIMKMMRVGLYHLTMDI